MFANFRNKEDTQGYPQTQTKSRYIPGDRLWVRETWQVDPCRPSTVCYRATGHNRICGWLPEKIKQGQKIITTTGHLWRPSIYMPRWAARITLEITDIRVERVQEISAGDALAEGICSLYVNEIPPYPVDAFHGLWDSINAKRGLGWAVNPWVWVVEFKRI